MAIPCPRCGKDIDANGRIEVLCSCGHRIRLQRPVLANATHPRKPTGRFFRFSVARDELEPGEQAASYRDQDPLTLRLRFDASVTPHAPLARAISALALVAGIIGLVVGLAKMAFIPTLVFLLGCGVLFMAAVSSVSTRQLTIVGDALVIRWRTWGAPKQMTFKLSDVSEFYSREDDNGAAAVFAKTQNQQTFLFLTNRRVSDYLVWRLNTYLPH